MPAVPKVPLGAATLVRKWHLDVNTGTYGSPVWTGIFGMTDFKFNLDPVMKDDSDLDSSGWKSESATAMGWAIEAKVERKVVEASPTTYNPGQEFLRGKALLIGSGNHVDVRFYEMTTGGPRVEAFRGWCSVQWKPEGGTMEDHDTVALTLSGQGELTAITHPDAGAAVPVLYSVSPATAAAAGGSLHRLFGSGFYAAGEADVLSMKIGVTNVPTFTVLSDNELIWLSPAKVAGPYVVYVTNTQGESATATVTVTYA